MIEVTILGQRNGVGIVGDEADAPRVDIHQRDSLYELRHRGHDGIMTQMSVNPVPHPQEDVVWLWRLVVVADAGGCEKVPQRPLGVGGVTRQGLAPCSCGGDRLEQVRIIEGDVERDDFGDADYVLSVQRGDDLLRGDMAPLVSNPTEKGT